MLQERIELSTSPLPRECSTTELLQHPFRGARVRRKTYGVQAQSGPSIRSGVGRLHEAERSEIEGAVGAG